MKTILTITNMTCPACKELIEDICSDFEKVKSSKVDLGDGTLTLEHDASFSTVSLIEEIESMGSYKVVK